jgi:hypothetical protein
MPVAVEDYARVDQRALELGCSLPGGLAVIPINFESAASRDELYTASHTTTVLKVFRENDVIVGSFFSNDDHPPYIVNKHFQWLGPTLFIPLALWSNNPDAVSLAIGVLGNCITDFFKGIPARLRGVKLDMVVETENGTYKKISYEGDVEGLKELQKIVKEMMK